MPDNYKAKIEKIVTIQNYIAGLIQTITDFVYIGKSYDELLSCEDYPSVFILFKEGEQSTVRENGNAIIYYDIVIKNRLEKELDNLAFAAKIAAKFEDYTLAGNCIGIIPGFPKQYYDSFGEIKGVITAISLSIEI